VAARDAAAVVAALTEAEVPCAKVATIAEVAANPQLRHRGQIAEVEHPTLGRMATHGVTVQLSETPGALARAAPTVGQHTEEVLREWLGMGGEEVAGLRRAGTV
jgi:crotonobetainyl-CoA:carnitine CoA-transferase CaiB-like acyl-CoA transferase